MNQNFSKSKLNEHKNSSKKRYENFKQYRNPNLISGDRILKQINCLRHKPLFNDKNDLINKIKVLPFQIYPEKYYEEDGLEISK